LQDVLGPKDDKGGTGPGPTGSRVWC